VNAAAILDVLHITRLLAAAETLQQAGRLLQLLLLPARAAMRAELLRSLQLRDDAWW
jgi:hypothetical protein